MNLAGERQSKERGSRRDIRTRKVCGENNKNMDHYSFENAVIFLRRLNLVSADMGH